jgi:hypothetical protein
MARQTRRMSAGGKACRVLSGWRRPVRSGRRSSIKLSQLSASGKSPKADGQGIASDRSYPGQPGFTTIKTIIKVQSRTEYHDRCTFDTRCFISSHPSTSNAWLAP